MKLGAMRHLITLTARTQTADGAGGFTETFTDLSPSTAYASIEAFGPLAKARLANNTIIAQLTHLVRMRYHQDVTTLTRITWLDRAGRTHTANVLDVQDVDEAGRELELACVELPAP